MLSLLVTPTLDVRESQRGLELRVLPCVQSETRRRGYSFLLDSESNGQETRLSSKVRRSLRGGSLRRGRQHEVCTVSVPVATGMEWDGLDYTLTGSGNGRSGRTLDKALHDGFNQGATLGQEAPRQVIERCRCWIMSNIPWMRSQTNHVEICFMKHSRYALFCVPAGSIYRPVHENPLKLVSSNAA
jgi:hypothetical protein